MRDRAARRVPREPAGAASRADGAAQGIDVTAFFMPEITGFARSSGEEFPILSYLSGLVSSPPPCWSRLRGAITAAYQLELGAAGGSYFLIEGSLPRPEVERCAQIALADIIPIAVEADGELAMFRVPTGGAFYAAWRGPFIIVGTKDQVNRALGAGTPELARTWRARLAQLPPHAPLAMWRSDALLTSLFGVATTSYLFVFDRMEHRPPAQVTGRVLVRYGNAADAAVAARRIQQGELQLAETPPVDLVDALRRMKVTQSGTLVEIGFDLGMFADLDLEALQRWFRSIIAAGPAARP
jgi:hypothetical protein